MTRGFENKVENELEDVFARIFPNVHEFRRLRLGDQDWDSLKHIELVTEIESFFEISLGVEELDTLTEFSSVLAFLEQRLGS